MGMNGFVGVASINTLSVTICVFDLLTVWDKPRKRERDRDCLLTTAIPSLVRTLVRAWYGTNVAGCPVVVSIDPFSRFFPLSASVSGHE